REPRPYSEPGPVDEPKCIVAANPQPFRIQFICATTDSAAPIRGRSRIMRRTRPTQSSPLPSRAKRPTGGGRGGGVAVSRPSGSRGRRPRGLLGDRFILPSGLLNAVEEGGLALYHFDP